MKHPILPLLLLISFRLFSQSDSAEYFFQKGLKEKQNGRKLESFRNFEKALQYNPSGLGIIRELASACYDLRKYPQAAEFYKKLVESGDESTGNFRMLLQLSFNLRQYDDVITYAGSLKKLSPAEKINYYLGKVNYERDNYGEALKYLAEAAKEEPQNAEVPYMMARSYADMMNYKQAIPYFHKAIELDPSKNYWIYEMGLIYYAMNDDNNALKYVLEAGEKGYQKDNDYLENLGICYLNAGKPNEGLVLFSDMLKRNPEDLNILNIIAETYYNKGNYKEAMEYWDRVLSYDKENAAALYMIGMCYQKTGEKEKGKLLCDKAIQMDPKLTYYKQKRFNLGL